MVRTVLTAIHLQVPLSERTEALFAPGINIFIGVSQNRLLFTPGINMFLDASICNWILLKKGQLSFPFLFKPLKKTR